MRYLFLILVTTVTIFASNLVFQKGYVLAHTTVFGDSTIDPSSSNITSHLSINRGDISSLKGFVRVSLVDLKSDNKKRDEHMYEAINTKKYKNTTYKIKSVNKNSSGSYTIKGTLNLHGITKNINMVGDIIQNGDTLVIKAKTSFKMSDFGIEPPKLLFLSVRDLLEMTIDTTYKLEN